MRSRDVMRPDAVSTNTEIPWGHHVRYNDEADHIPRLRFRV
jgi:hypothetical protein